MYPGARPWRGLAVYLALIDLVDIAAGIAGHRRGPAVVEMDLAFAFFTADDI